MSLGDFHLDLNPFAVEDLAYDEDAQDLAQDAGEIVADRSAELAPKDTGEGAASIHAEQGVDADGAYADVSWDRDHFYMGFHETGTEHQPPNPFLRPGLDGASI